MPTRAVSVERTEEIEGPRTHVVAGAGIAPVTEQGNLEAFAAKVPDPVADRLLEDLQETEEDQRPENGEKDGDQRESGRTEEFELQP